MFAERRPHSENYSQGLRIRAHQVGLAAQGRGLTWIRTNKLGAKEEFEPALVRRWSDSCEWFSGRPLHGAPPRRRWSSTPPPGGRAHPSGPPTTAGTPVTAAGTAAPPPAGRPAGRHTAHAAPGGRVGPA
eukprot:1195500-Prorocentrum_minimum.AAC.19